MSLYCVSFLLCFKCFFTDVENYMNVIILLQLMIFIQISNNLDTRVEAKSLRPNDSFILFFFFLSSWWFLEDSFCYHLISVWIIPFSSSCRLCVVVTLFLVFLYLRMSWCPLHSWVMCPLNSLWLIEIMHLVSTFFVYLFVWVFLTYLFFYYAH